GGIGGIHAALTLADAGKHVHLVEREPCIGGQMARKFDERVDLTVGFFTQLLGTALGLDERALGVQRMLRWQLPQPAGAVGGAHVRD
ncbi:MAG: FAD-dependent oxidoreductase, partial [Solirubrobacteraceae bacterium]